MGHEALKLELIEWLSRLEDEESIEYLKIVKDSSLKENDWWHELTVDQTEAIKRGLNDIAKGHIVSHEEVKRKYGL
jgi:predicted transcriptional regulator